MAAEAELVKHCPSIDMDSLYAEAERALEALSVVLGWNEWFFGRAAPGLFDSSVFAYTHLLLDSNMGWKEDRLVKSVQKWENLVQHRERILDRYLASH
jgi:metaxin